MPCRGWRGSEEPFCSLTPLAGFACRRAPCGGSAAGTQRVSIAETCAGPAPPPRPLVATEAATASVRAPRAERARRMLPKEPEGERCAAGPPLAGLSPAPPREGACITGPVGRETMRSPANCAASEQVNSPDLLPPSSRHRTDGVFLARAVALRPPTGDRGFPRPRPFRLRPYRRVDSRLGREPE
jgi:hypothetical protein